MTDRLTITLAQLNPVVGAITGNIEKVRGAREKAPPDKRPNKKDHLMVEPTWGTLEVRFVCADYDPAFMKGVWKVVKAEICAESCPDAPTFNDGTCNDGGPGGGKRGPGGGGEPKNGVQKMGGGPKIAYPH